MTVVVEHVKGLLEFTRVSFSLCVLGISFVFRMPVARYVENCIRVGLRASLRSYVLTTHEQSVKENSPGDFKKQPQ